MKHTFTNESHSVFAFGTSLDKPRITAQAEFSGDLHDPFKIDVQRLDWFVTFNGATHIITEAMTELLALQEQDHGTDALGAMKFHHCQKVNKERDLNRVPATLVDDWRVKG